MPHRCVDVSQAGIAKRPRSLEDVQVVEVPVVGDSGVPDIVVIQSQHGSNLGPDRLALGSGLTLAERGG